MSVRDEVREAQTSQFEAMGETSEVKAKTVAIYDGVDALNQHQKRLLIRDALGMAHRTLQETVNTPEATAGFVMLAAGLVALAGYANESMREDLGETSTGDSMVDKVLGDFRSLVKEAASNGMSSEQRERVAQVAERVNAHMAEHPEADFDSVLRSEYEKFREEFPEFEPMSAKASDEETPGYGLYL